ncbi:helix-turn-helix domain-containing protein [Raineyella sp. W15-4]|uniref:helix-turn-helix domain-containing protein n=1 Tax=Raineyella sp. W15-4 TaxID=3081651 RepID=UPI002954FD36|nr:helix-turn-helix domain-containing protein [Raineyella sp. W15-4]WOQ18294.1 helix-turn-helix domain-containing protein [Raineyella sp. W15-4]
MVPGGNGSRITGEERERLMLVYVRRYRAGESIPSLATDTGRAEGFVEGLLREAGVALRRRGNGLAGPHVAGATQAASGPADPAPEPDGPASAQDQLRDLERSPEPLTDWGLPTPPLGVLVKKKDKGRAKELAAATVKAHRKRVGRSTEADDGKAAGGGSASRRKKASAEKSGKKKHPKKSHR